jgi:hypothetical protein
MRKSVREAPGQMVEALRQGILDCALFIVKIWPLLDTTTAFSAGDASIGDLLGTIPGARSCVCE